MSNRTVQGKRADGASMPIGKVAAHWLVRLRWRGSAIACLVACHYP
jgi:hypothetical protein